MMIHISKPDQPRRVVCGNCAWAGTSDDVDCDIDDERLDFDAPDDDLAGECPECGSLAWFEEDIPAKTVEAEAEAEYVNYLVLLYAEDQNQLLWHFTCCPDNGNAREDATNEALAVGRRDDFAAPFTYGADPMSPDELFLLADELDKAEFSILLWRCRECGKLKHWMEVTADIEDSEPGPDCPNCDFAMNLIETKRIPRTHKRFIDRLCDALPGINPARVVAAYERALGRMVPPLRE